MRCADEPYEIAPLILYFYFGPPKYYGFKMADDMRNWLKNIEQNHVKRVLADDDTADF